MTRLGSGPEKCALCGMVAVGYARINDDRYCHGDDTAENDMTCYEQASVAEGRLAIWRGDSITGEALVAWAEGIRRKADTRCDWYAVDGNTVIWCSETGVHGHNGNPPEERP